MLEKNNEENKSVQDEPLTIANVLSTLEACNHKLKSQVESINASSRLIKQMADKIRVMEAN